MSLSVILFDKAPWRDRLLPLSATRPVGNLRIGICTLNEKWEKIWNSPVHYITMDYLQAVFNQEESSTSEYLIIRANVLPSDALIEEMDALQVGESLILDTEWIAMKLDFFPQEIDSVWQSLKPNFIKSTPEFIQYPEDIFLKNKSQLLFDYNLLTKGRSSADIGGQNMLYGDWVFVEEGVELTAASLNSLAGPIYIGRNAIIEEGTFLRGHVAIGAESRVKMGAKLYPNLSIGPGSTVSGELNNTVIWGNSAKGHEGYLGCSVLGEGCNIGAGTSNSNLKNNWQNVRLFDYQQEQDRDTGILKCGLIMGDHAMLGINSSVNTGTILAVAAQVAMSNFIPKFVPDFSWLNAGKMEVYRYEKFMEMLERRKAETGTDYSQNIAIFEHIFKQTSRLRDEVINNKIKSNYA